MRRSICRATFSATNCASSSGALISWISILICLPCAIFEISSVIFSISAPLRPITMPGRAVWIVTRIEFQARSITIFATAANCSFFFTYARISRSLCKNAGSSCGDAYQRDRQSRFTPSLNPIGLTFCPIKLLLRRFRGLLRFLRLFLSLPSSFLFRLPGRRLFLRFLVRQNDPNVTGPLQNSGAASAGTGLHSFESWTFTDAGLLHDQAVGFQVRIVFGVRDRALERFVDQERCLLW